MGVALSSLRVRVTLARASRAAAVCAAGAIIALGAAPAAGAAAHHRHHKATKRHHKATKHRRRRITHPSPASPAAQCANANTPATSASVAVMRAATVCLVNQQRNQRGLPSLNESSQLDSSAQTWNDTMVSTGIFTHGPGNAFATRITASGYDWQAAGENIATGYLTPHGVVTAWMASADHCRNILDPSFRDVGTGETPSGVTSEQSSPATWTQDFGLRTGQSPPSGNHGPQNGCPY